MKDAEWLSTVEAARRLGVIPATLRRLIDRGELPAYRFGRVIRLKAIDVAEFVERARISGTTPRLSLADVAAELGVDLDAIDDT